MEFTVEMALVDYIPVLLFTIASFILICDLKNKMSRLVHLVFTVGMLGIAVAGACKATWKLLIATNIASIEIFNKMFMPTQSMGFLLAGLALLIMLIQKKDRRQVRLNSVMGYIAMMVAGLALIDACLSVVAAKIGKKSATLFFLISFICSMCMGYLSSQDFAEAIWNWIAEGVNIVGQGALLIGTVKLHKAELKDMKL